MLMFFDAHDPLRSAPPFGRSRLTRAIAGSNRVDEAQKAPQNRDFPRSTHQRL